MEFLSFFGVTGVNNIATGLLAVVALAYAIGDYVSYKTKAMCSMIFVTAAIFLFGFWTGAIPTDIFDRTVLAPYFAFVMPFILVHMGTLMKVRNLMNEWKTITIALTGIIGFTIGLLFIVGPIIGHIKALVAAGPLAGGIVATFIASEAANARGLTEYAVFAALILAIQNFFGLPIASLCLKNEGRRLLEKHRSGDTSGGAEAAKLDPEIPAYRLFPETPKPLRTPFILMFKAFLVGYLAVWFGETAALLPQEGILWIIRTVAHPLVLALIFGIIAYELGFLEYDIFTKANIAGYAFFFALIPVWAGLRAATPQMVLNMIFPIVLCFGLAIICMAVTSFVIGKLILGYTWHMAMAVSITCLFGFPATFIISNEVSQSIAANEEEKKYVLDRILPKMLIGGFTTVTVGSVILAGYVAGVIADYPMPYEILNNYPY